MPYSPLTCTCFAHSLSSLSLHIQLDTSNEHVWARIYEIHQPNELQGVSSNQRSLEGIFFQEGIMWLLL